MPCIVLLGRRHYLHLHERQRATCLPDICCSTCRLRRSPRGRALLCCASMHIGFTQLPSCSSRLLHPPSFGHLLMFGHHLPHCLEGAFPVWATASPSLLPHLPPLPSLMLSPSTSLALRSPRPSYTRPSYATSLLCDMLCIVTVGQTSCCLPFCETCPGPSPESTKCTI
jgi:hypothetical protein